MGLFAHPPSLQNPLGAAPVRQRFVTSPLSAMPGESATGRSAAFASASVPEAKPSKDALRHERTLFRLAIEVDSITPSDAARCLEATLGFLRSAESIERIDQQALRTAAGILLRVEGELEIVNASDTLRSAHRQLCDVFQAWHVYRELLKILDLRADMLARTGGAANTSMLACLFQEESRSMLYDRVSRFVVACEQLGARLPALCRAEWNAALLMLRTPEGGWAVPPVDCLDVCAGILREVADRSVVDMLRTAADCWNIIRGEWSAPVSGLQPSNVVAFPEPVSYDGPFRYSLRNAC